MDNSTNLVFIPRWMGHKSPISTPLLKEIRLFDKVFLSIFMNVKIMLVSPTLCVGCATPHFHTDKLQLI